MKWRIALLSALILIILSTGFTGNVKAAASIAVTVEGKGLVFTQPPVIINSRVLVPMRVIFEKLGAKLTWDGVTQTVYAEKNNLKIELVIGSLNATVNGKATALDVPAQLINNSTMVPIRFVSEAMGQVVSYNSTKRTVIIRSKAGMDAAIAALLGKLVVLPQSAYNKEEVTKIKARLARIDLKVLQKLVDSGETIILVNGPITDVPEYENLKGLVPRGWEETGISWDDIPGVGGFPVVVRIGYSEPSYENGHSAINLELHETSHAIDSYVFDDISQKSEFINIWKREELKLFGEDGYLSSYSEEYYAEAFAMYHLSDESSQKLKQLAPLTFQFIQTSIEKL